ncbi:hypothetical protein IEE91_13330 [Kocuria sp. cx-455]|uniref:hypothetical protein n=1 Tax=unclassified Candidatus Sulfotelmatobacter TaxID=2635724 RepID=UPI001685C71F|nr:MULTISPECIES: hypothetical protein [unclassified Candidatus Sulfotelmatobacter]MBD2763497.1 hypothetical protein [Kocuria sp. cx-116]MBD2766154.1 hypothetical protein [Kocuria sp. cx-455]
MKNAARKKLQHFGLGAAAAAALLTATGCGYVSPQATADEYAPSDGIQADLGDVKVRNFMILAEDANSEGRVIGSVINEGSEPATLSIDADGATAEVQVPANDAVMLEKSDPVTIDRAGAEPGLMVETELEADGQSSTQSVPVLDHTYPRYASLMPGGAPSTPGNPSNTPKAESEEGGH